jgi:hypothetical protein
MKQSLVVIAVALVATVGPLQAQIRIPNLSDIPGMPNIDVLKGVENVVTPILGAPAKQIILTARSNAGPVHGVPPDMLRKLRQLGVSENLLQRVRWSNNWRAVDTIFSMDARAMCLQDVIVFRNLSDVYNDVALWVHELKHFEQFERLGLDRFALEYTVNRQTYENEANNAENAAIGRINEGALNASTYYSYCATPVGNSPAIVGGQPPGSACWIPTPAGPVWGTVVGFHQ